MGMGFKIVLFSAVTLIIIAAADVALAQSRTACNPAVNPHSFNCQHETFNGKFFPLVKLNPRTLQGNWRSLVYAPAPQATSLLGIRVSPKNPRTPVALTNPDGSLVGALAWPNDRQIRYLNFRASGNHLAQASAVKILDAGTAQVVLANPRERAQELLTCRVFVRAKNQHLLCQWLRNQGQGFKFIGYLGWVR